MRGYRLDVPVALWFSEQARAFDTHFIPDLLEWVGEKTLLILDRGFYDFRFFADLMAQGTHFLTRLKSNAKLEVVRRLTYTDTVKDMLVRLGSGQKGAPILTVRVVEIRFGRRWYRYVTSVLDPALLPPFVVADLYRRRWRIEDAFHTVKRLLNLAYLWTGSRNGIQLQIWATWLFYALLVDLGDAVADALSLPFDRISLEMLFRSLYHFIQAAHQGKASDPVAYLTAPENQDLDVVKRIRTPVPRLDLAPYPI
jgi:IS4 transposase